MGKTFGGRLAEQFALGRRLCVGIDPHDHLLDDWDLPRDASGAERMGRAVVAAAIDAACVVKPQIAFFERFGAAGFTALERILADAREAELLVIADVKRGDVGSTFAAYAQAWLAPGSPLEADAMTAHAYHGFGSLAGAFDLVQAHGKGLFVLSATSNPEARDLQQARDASGRLVAQHLFHAAEHTGADLHPHEPVGSVGVVLGATVPLTDFGIDITGRQSARENSRPAVPILAPGFGHQGAKLTEAGQLFGTLGPGLLAAESRSVLAGGPERLRSRIVEHSTVLQAALYDSKREE